MKATIIYYSTTGNTRYTGMKIADELKNFNINTQFVDGIEIIKALRLGRKDGKIEIPSPVPSILGELKETVVASDIIGVGSLAYYHSSGPGFSDIFSPTVLPPELFANVKYVFGFATWGGTCGPTLDILLTTVQGRCHSAKFVGGLEIKVPDNYALYLPPKPYRDEWDAKEIQRIKDFGVEIGSRITGKDPTAPPAFKNNPLARNDLQQKSTEILGPIKLDNTLCKKCGTCVRVCPYSSVTIDPAVNDGFPVFDPASCWGCCRCFNTCPFDCINYTNLSNSETRMRHPTPFLDPQTWATPADCSEKGMKVVVQPLPDLVTMHARAGASWPIKL